MNQTMTKKDVQTREEARQMAVDWQEWQGERSLTWSQVAEWTLYFETLAAKFDLEEEFKANGII